MNDHSNTTSEAVTQACRRERLKKALTYWRGPFTYHDEGGIITDAHGSRIIDIRGWGRLTGTGSEGRGLPERVASVIQDDIGVALADFLNSSA
jgi:hypothetical protein